MSYLDFMVNYAQEYAKCLYDKSRTYFIENFLSTFDATVGKEVPFILFPRQKAFLQSLANNNNTIAIKHRQAGITTTSAAWICGQVVFASKKSPETVLCIANKLDKASEITNTICTFLNQVPRWMWGADFYSPDPDSKKNTASIYVKKNKGYIELFNGCKIYARSSSENAARGIPSVSILLLDEAAFIQNGIATYASAKMASAAVKNSRCIMVSTPNGKDPLYYRTYSKALKKENNFNPVEFKWYQDLRYNRFLSWSRKNAETGSIDIIKEKVLDKIGNIEYNEERWRQLEKDGWKPTSPWYEDICKSLNNDSQMIAQEVEVSFLGSADNVIPVETIEYHMEHNVVILPEDWHLRDVYVKETWIWKDPIPGHRYVCACDISSGSGEDRTAIEIFDIDAIDENGFPYFEQVLEYYGKKTADEIGEILNNYGKVYNDALVVVEDIGGYGSAAILTLLSLKYPNLYYDDPTLKTYTIQKKYQEYNINPDGKLPGFHTSNIRTQMISNFVALLKENTFRVRSIRVIDEMETWVFKNGRPDHMSGSHDDSLTALAMGLFVAEYSMLRTDRLKKKDTAIVKSWYVSNTQPSVVNIKNNIDISNKTKLPFYSGKSIQESKKLNAMLMLCGFKGKWQ